MTILNLKSLDKYSEMLSDNLKHLLDSHSINMLELSTELKISYTAIYKIVHKKSNPTLDTLLKIALYFNISVSEILGEIPIISQTKNRKVIKLVSIVQTEDVLLFLAKQQNNYINYEQIFVSVNQTLEQELFSIISDQTMEPFFKCNTILIFERLKSDILCFNNSIVLTVSDNNSLSLKKLIIEGKEVFIQNINVSIPPQIIPASTKVLGILIQAITNF